MTERFSVRPDRTGFSVYDLWTGETVVIAMTPQDGLSREDADHTVEMLNRRTAQSAPSLLQ
jgi:hypothetical protein